MVSRRTFLALAAGSVAAPRLASAQQATQRVALYANVGADLTHYDVDVAGAELIKRETVTLPAGIGTLSLCRVQQQRFRIWQGRDGTPRQRVQHRSRDWRSAPAWGPDTVADAPHPHQHGHSIREHSGGVQ
jgi:hypothetical protein